MFSPAGTAGLRGGLSEHEFDVLRKCSLTAQSDLDQRNAAIGVAPEGTTIDAIRAHIETCRAAHASRKAAIQAILADGQLENAGKLAALDALGS